MSNTRKLWKYNDYQTELERIDNCIKNTKSVYLKRDYIKHKNRLLKELCEYNKLKNIS